MATLRNKRKLAALSKENCEELPGATRHKTQMFPDHKKTTSLKFLRKLREESQRSCRKSSVGRKTAY